MTFEPTGAVILYYNYKLVDVDNDGRDELFILRTYYDRNDRFFNKLDLITSLKEFCNCLIRQNFISESYKQVNGRVSELAIDGEPIMTEAFGGGHWGIYFFLLSRGK